MSGVWKIEPLTESNYHVWKDDAENAMILGLIDAIESDDQPTKNDRVARAWLVMNVSQHLRSLVRGCETALDVWDKLKEEYETNGLAGLMDIMQQLLHLQLGETDEGEETIASYYSRVRQLGNAFDAAGENLSETLLCLAALNGLPETYAVHKVMLTAGNKRDEKKTDEKQNHTLRLVDVFATLQQAEQSMKDISRPSRAFGLAAACIDLM